jgi:hypothetical protein
VGCRYFDNADLLTHSVNVYQSDCHPDEEASDYCWDDEPQSCSDNILEAKDSGGASTSMSAFSETFLYHYTVPPDDDVAS